VVRRSVANDLDDLGKVHPDLSIRTAKRWLEDASPEQRKLVEHALGSAEKRCDPKALALLGYGRAPRVAVEAAEGRPPGATPTRRRGEREQQGQHAPARADRGARDDDVRPKRTSPAATRWTWSSMGGRSVQERSTSCTGRPDVDRGLSPRGKTLPCEGRSLPSPPRGPARAPGRAASRGRARSMASGDTAPWHPACCALPAGLQRKGVSRAQAPRPRRLRARARRLERLGGALPGECQPRHRDRHAAAGALRRRRTRRLVRRCRRSSDPAGRGDLRNLPHEHQPADSGRRGLGNRRGRTGTRGRPLHGGRTGGEPGARLRRRDGHDVAMRRRTC